MRHDDVKESKSLVLIGVGLGIGVFVAVLLLSFGAKPTEISIGPVKFEISTATLTSERGSLQPITPTRFSSASEPTQIASAPSVP